MLSNKIKRCLSLFMAIFMLISLMPASAFAAGEEDHDHSHESVEQTADNTNESAEAELPAEDVPPATVNPAIAEYQAEIDRILTKYFGGASATAEEIKAAVDAMEEDYFLNWCYMDFLLLEENLMWACEDGILTEAEVLALLDSNPTLSVAAEIVYAKAAVMESDGALFTETSALEGNILGVEDTQSTVNVDGTTITATAKGSITSKKTNEITLTNNSGVTAKLAFDYTITQASSYSGLPATSGSFSQTLKAGESITISVTSKNGFSNTTVTLTLTNVTLTAAAASSNVTFVYDSSLGSVTVGGNAVANGGIVNISGTDGAELVATPASGSTFLGWTDVEGNLLYSAATYSYTPASDTTVKALFANEKGNAVFTVGGNYFDDLNAAATFASSAASKTIVVASNGIVPAGNYTIPTGVTLQIPFDASNTLYTTEPDSDSSLLGGNGTYVKPTVYRKLTLATGAHITVEGTGSINLSAKMHAAGGGKTNAGAPTGPCSYMHMNAGSSITLNDTSKLYAWGFITGQGSITANSGTTVYEFFQFEDFRGGSQTLDETMKTNRVFPLSQYYVQNIEASLTVEAGASVICRTNVFMSKMSIKFNVEFIGGDSAMFALSSGSVTKRYDPATDRLILDGTGTFACSSTSLEISGSSIDSADYILPLNSNISLYIRDGSEATISQDIAVLPGTEIVLEEGAKVTLAEGTEIYAFDADQWAGYCYSNSADVKFVALPYAPGRTYTRTESDLVDAKILVDGEIDASKGRIYTTAGGANVYTNGTGKITYQDGTAASLYQLKQKAATYDEIDVTAAQLKNGDGTYTDTSTAAAGSTFVYCTEHDVWYTGECAKCAEASHTCVFNKEVADAKYLKTPATCTVQAVYWKSCECGEASTNAADVFSAGDLAAHTPDTDDGDCTTAITCTVCGEVTTAAKDAHTGGTATCEKLAECEVCGKEYGELAAHTPEEDDGDCTTAITCTVCGEVTTAAKDAHTGGEATCKVQAVCGVCGQSYGDLNAENHKGETEVRDAAAATCGEAGYTGDTYCLDCGEKIADGEEIPANGEHTVSDGAAWSYDYYGHWQICETCGEKVGAVDHTFNTANNKTTCTACGLGGSVDNYSVSPFLTLESNVLIGFNFNLTGFAGIPEDVMAENMGLLAFYTKTPSSADSTYDTADYVISGMEYNAEKKAYEVRSNGIAAKDMGDSVWYKMYIRLSDGTYLYSGRFEYSPKAYAKTVLSDNSGKFGAELKSLCVALMNYGAAAQQYFANKGTYSYTTLMNADFANYQNLITDYSSDMITKRVTNSKPVDFNIDMTKFAAQDFFLSLEGAIEMNFSFTSNQSFTEAGIVVWDPATYAAATKLSLDNASAVYIADASQINGNTFIIKYAGMPAKQMGDTVMISAFVKINGVYYYTNVLGRSIEQYAELKISDTSAHETLRNAMKAMVVYGDYAIKYFNR